MIFTIIFFQKKHSPVALFSHTEYLMYRCENDIVNITKHYHIIT